MRDLTGLGRSAGSAAILLLALAGEAFAVCRPDVADLRTPDGGAARFAVEIADTPETRARGLMHRTDLAESQGMLFLFDTVAPVAFWMKDTPLPLDIIFIDETGRVISIAERTTPFSEETLPSGGPVRAVLEINGGLSDRFGIEPGAELRHPALDQDRAVWPCD